MDRDLKLSERGVIDCIQNGKYWAVTGTIIHEIKNKICIIYKIKKIVVCSVNNNNNNNNNMMPRNRLPSVMKRYSPTGRRNHGRPLKRLLDT